MLSFGQQQTVSAADIRKANAEAGWLYPLALFVPGTQHIVNNVLKDTVEELPWWPAWTAAAKCLCQSVDGQRGASRLASAED